ncbi:hypothetical protein [Cupriavidus necator]
MLSSAQLSELNSDPVFGAMRQAFGGKKPMVVVGYSGLEYQNPQLVEQLFRDHLRTEIQNSGGPNNVVVVMGATTPGIGRLYDIAKHEFGVQTAGIVSMHAMPKVDTNGQPVNQDVPFQLWQNGAGIPGVTTEQMKQAGVSPSCDATVFIKTPGDSWEVNSPTTGLSYTVAATFAGGRPGALLALGGGQVAYAEMTAGVGYGVPIYAYPNLQPNAANVEAKTKTNPNFVGMPTRQFYDDNAGRVPNTGEQHLRLDVLPQNVQTQAHSVGMHGGLPGVTPPPPNPAAEVKKSPSR